MQNRPSPLGPVAAGAVERPTECIHGRLHDRASVTHEEEQPRVRKEREEPVEVAGVGRFRNEPTGSIRPEEREKAIPERLAQAIGKIGAEGPPNRIPRPPYSLDKVDQVV